MYMYMYIVYLVWEENLVAYLDVACVYMCAFEAALLWKSWSFSNVTTTHVQAYMQADSLLAHVHTQTHLYMYVYVYRNSS